jgi:hypothetical protein
MIRNIFNILIAICLFTGCASYYLEEAQSITSIPNSAPFPEIERNKCDIRVNLGLIGSLDTSKTSFNDGNYTSDMKQFPAVIVKAPYSSENIHLNHTKAQGYLAIDYTIVKQLFVYSNIDLGIFEGKYYGSGNIGIGIHQRIMPIVLQYYIVISAKQLYSKATLLKRYGGDTPDEIINTVNKSYGIEPGIGIQIENANQYVIWPHFFGGIGIQWLRYCYSDPNTNNYYTPIVLPYIGLIEKIGQRNQIGLSINCPFNDVIVWPSMTLIWSYLIRLRQ